MRYSDHAPRRLPRSSLLGLLLAAGILGGCSSGTQLVDMWKDPSAQMSPLRRVLVVAVRRDPVARRVWEDGFVSALEKKGVTATPSYDPFSRDVPDTAEIDRVVQDRGYDGVLFAHRVGSSTQTTHVPGYTRLEPVWVRDRWTDTYHAYWREVYEPGYTETERVVRYRVDLWSTSSGWRLVWSGTTESISPRSSRDANTAIAKLIVPELVAQGVIAR